MKFRFTRIGDSGIERHRKGGLHGNQNHHEAFVGQEFGGEDLQKHLADDRKEVWREQPKREQVELTHLEVTFIVAQPIQQWIELPPTIVITTTVRETGPAAPAADLASRSAPHSPHTTPRLTERHPGVLCHRRNGARRPDGR